MNYDYDFPCNGNTDNTGFTKLQTLWMPCDYYRVFAATGDVTIDFGNGHQVTRKKGQWGKGSGRPEDFFQKVKIRSTVNETVTIVFGDCIEGTALPDGTSQDPIIVTGNITQIGSVDVFAMATATGKSVMPSGNMGADATSGLQVAINAGLIDGGIAATQGAKEGLYTKSFGWMSQPTTTNYLPMQGNALGTPTISYDAGNVFGLYANSMGYIKRASDSVMLPASGDAQNAAFSTADIAQNVRANIMAYKGVASGPANPFDVQLQGQGTTAGNPIFVQLVS